MTASHILEKPLTPDELEKCKEAFTKMKSYKDGTMQGSEFIDYLIAINIPTTPAQAEAYLAFFRAKRGDDMIHVDEVMEYLRVLHDAKAIAMKVAQAFDKNGDGIISQEEFEIGIKSLASYDPAQYGEKGKISFDVFLKEADTNKDGKIQIEELAAWLSKK